MSKGYSILWLLILLTIFTETQQSTSCGDITPSKADDCKDDSLTQDDKDDDDHVHCCYVKEEKSSDPATCQPLTSKQYKNLGKYIELYEKNNDYKHKINIDCQSSYMNLFLFALLMQIILL